jgi:hypothetical protein
MTTDSRTETERAFAFLQMNERPPKPRSRGVTEIRGPYYSPGRRRTVIRVEPASISGRPIRQRDSLASAPGG